MNTLKSNLMMKKISTLLACALLVVPFGSRAQGGLFISEVTDPADDYTGRFIELYNAGSEVMDFGSSTFYLSRQSNGGTSWGEVQLAGAVGPGETFVIGGSGFQAIFGFPPDQESGILTGNGNDPYLLFQGGNHSTGTLYDSYGERDTDGTGTPWEYTDSRAVRKGEITGPNPTWTASEWTIAPAGNADCDPGVHTVLSGPEPGIYTVGIDSLLFTTPVGGNVDIPVRISELSPADNIISFQMELTYDPGVILFTGHTLAGTIAEGGTTAVNSSVPGSLSMSYMNTAALSGSGAILILQFDVQALDSTDLILDNVWLNDKRVLQPVNGRVIIAEGTPPVAAITYNDADIRFADTLLITATFSEPMDALYPVWLNLDGAATLQDAGMTRANDTVWTYTFPVPKAGGPVSLTLGNGRDMAGNALVPEPVSGGSFTIIEFSPGDVDDDGTILAYDAALALQHSVGLDPLPEIDPLPWERWRDSTANVDGSGGITAYDAGLILQYSAGVITSFPEGVKKSANPAEVSIEQVGNELYFFASGDLVGINISAVNTGDVLGEPVVMDKNFLSAFNTDGGIYRLGLCSAYPPAETSPFLKIPLIQAAPVALRLLVNRQQVDEWLNISTGFDENREHLTRIYPVPVVDRLIIRGLKSLTLARICSPDGKTVLVEDLGPGKETLDTGQLPAGHFLLILENAEGLETHPFIKN